LFLLAAIALVLLAAQTYCVKLHLQIPIGKREIQ